MSVSLTLTFSITLLYVCLKFLFLVSFRMLITVSHSSSSYISKNAISFPFSLSFSLSWYLYYTTTDFPVLFFYPFLHFSFPHTYSVFTDFFNLLNYVLHPVISLIGLFLFSYSYAPFLEFLFLWITFSTFNTSIFQYFCPWFLDSFFLFLVVLSYLITTTTST